MPRIDVAIITGLLEEFKLLRELLHGVEEIEEKSEFWYRGRVKGARGRNYEIVLAYQKDMGPLDGNTLADHIIARWDPAYIVVVGIAGSMDSDVDLGDVVVSQQIFY